MSQEAEVDTGLNNHPVKFFIIFTISILIFIQIINIKGVEFEGIITKNFDFFISLAFMRVQKFKKRK
jgi:hypothetical protein